MFLFLNIYKWTWAHSYDSISHEESNVQENIISYAGYNLGVMENIGQVFYNCICLVGFIGLTGSRFTRTDELFKQIWAQCSYFKDGTFILGVLGERCEQHASSDVQIDQKTLHVIRAAIYIICRYGALIL